MTINYNLGIPASGNNPSSDQPLMQTNTNSIDTLLQVDHFSFKFAPSGTHKQVTLTNQSAPGIGSGSGVLYCNTVSAASQPFWQNAAGSKQISTFTGTPSVGANGTSFLPGGAIIQWGSSASTGNVSFPSSFPNNVFSVVLTSNVSGATSGALTIYTNSITTSGFKIFVTGSTAGYTPFYWMAIGN